MGRVLGIDYGKKRTGISVTDPLQIIVSGLDTVDTHELKTFLMGYFDKEQVEKVVIGMPRHADGNFTLLKPDIDNLANFINNKFPKIIIDFEDESFTSQHAKQIIFDSGVKKKKRKDKKLVDKVSAILILQKYLKHI
jgi:putative Holliday junction resolvase